MQNLIQKYLDNLVMKGYSDRTVNQYKIYLNKFAEFVVNLEDLNADKVTEFHKTLQDKKKSTQAYYLIVIRNFLKFLGKNKIKSMSPEEIELPKVPQREIKILDKKELKKLLTVIKKSDYLFAIIHLILSTGLRISELCALNRSELKDEMTIRGKGNKIRLVFLTDKGKEVVGSYLSSRNDDNEALFVDENNKRITPRKVQYCLKNYGKEIGINLYPHMLRHYHASLLLKNGADLFSIQQMLGHANISTTQNYLHVSNQELKETHKKYCKL